MHEIISKTRSAHANALYFLHGRLRAFTTNQIHLEHDQIYRRFQEIEVVTFFDSEVVSLAIKNKAIFASM